MLWQRKSRNAALDRELQSHMELEAEEQRRNGMPAGQAAFAAQRALGNSALIAEQVRAAWGFVWISQALQDVRFAIRLLRRDRGFTAAAVVPLAFAIGCTACALTLADAVLYRPIGIRDPGRLTAIYQFSRQRNAYQSCSYPDFRDVRSLGALVESAAAFVRFPVNLRSADVAERVNGEMVAGDYFRTAGISPVLGRPILPADEEAGAPAVTLISYALWESRYLRNPSVLGSQVWINDVSFTIIGVMPRGYGGTLLDWYANPSLWIPLGQIRQMLPPFRGLDFENHRAMPWLMAIARLRQGVAAGQVQAAINTLTANLPERRDMRFAALPSNQARFFPGRRASTVRIIWVLVAVSIAALLIACFNLANLLLVRTAARQKEIGARLALGAQRLRLLRQFGIENAALAGCACALGLPMALALTGAAQTFQDAFGLSVNLDPDARALAISFVAGIATAMAAGLAPAWTSSRMAFISMMKGGMPGRSAGPWRVGLRDVFVTVQVACAMAALVSAALLFQNLRARAAVPLGYSPHGIVIGEVDTLSAGTPPTERDRVYRTLLAELRAQTPGAALAGDAMPTRVETRIQLAASGAPERWTRVNSMNISDGYVELLKIQMTAGRAFLASDDRQSRPVIILNRDAAKLFWPEQNPIGKRLRIRGESSDREVVGLVGDVRYRPLADGESKEPLAFLPLFQRDAPVAMIHAVPRGDIKSFTPALRRIVARTVKDMPLSGVQPLEERVQSGLSQVRLVSQATGLVGAAGVALALAGILAMASYRVAQRKSEIAVRIAIGAEPGQVIRSYVTRGLAIGLTGSALGLMPALWSTGLLRSALRGVDAPGALLFGISGLALALASGAASWAAARRIARIQPAEVLRMQ